MNERIQELAEQARQYANSMYPSGLDIPKWGPAYHEKFAELIVQECMIICEDVAERNDPAIACYYEIKRTFRS
jgi:hypothetical protein